RKTHNEVIHTTVNKLKQEKEQLGVESYAKSRALSNPKIFRDENMVRDYGRRLKEIEKRVKEIDEEIKSLLDKVV
ncbi:MAG: hypothetical protein V1727_06585, partial [Candidatus Omnitrophota bacterium]